MRPWLGFSPTRPQHDAGMRIEPPPSLACASGTMPDATAAAAPPLDPPGVREVSHGLWVAPQATGSVVGTLPSSGLFVRPAMTSPASRNRLTSVVSASEMTFAFLSATLPLLIRWPAYAANRSLMRNGTPRSGPFGNDALASGVACVIEPTDDHRVQHRVDLLDPFDRRLEQFERRHVALRNQGGLIDRVHPPGVSSQGAHPACVARSMANVAVARNLDSRDAA